MRFDEMEFDSEFDGIWASASLLHVLRHDMPAVFDRFERALKPGGVWFMSFKAGDDEVFRDGRLFTNYTEEALRDFLNSRRDLDPLKLWTTVDTRRDHADEVWTNALVIKTHQNGPNTASALRTAAVRMRPASDACSRIAHCAAIRKLTRASM